MAPVIDRIPKGWGRWIDIGPGWFDIVLRLDAQIAAVHPDYEVYQVKEKFGGLRYYTSLDGDPQVDPWIQAAEDEAEHSCEVCAADAATSSTGGWLHTLCAKHTMEN
jgi:hypothetical protein